MYIPSPYFKNIPQIGDLILDYIFVEDGYPLLFTCVAKERIFLCLCRTLTPEQKWVLSEIQLQDLEKLIRNELCIKDVFKSYIGGKSCIVKWRKEFVSEQYEVIPTAYLPDEELPSKDIFLDDEDSEIYLEQVKNRIQSIKEKNIQAELESNGYIVMETIPYVGITVSKGDIFELTYRDRKCEINTVDSVNFSIEDCIVEKTKINNEMVQAVSANILPAA